MNLRRVFLSLLESIRTRIILPYLVLTLVVAGIGAYVVTNLVTGTLQERFDNQLLDAGRIVADQMVGSERNRLSVLRAVAGTEGVPQAVADADHGILAGLVPQIAANGQVDYVFLLDMAGEQVYGWSAAEGMLDQELDWTEAEELQLVLEGYVDEQGDKRVVLVKASGEHLALTAGPVFNGSQQVGAVLVGSGLRQTALELRQSAIAHVTLYDSDGEVLETSLQSGAEEIDESLVESAALYDQVHSGAESEVPLQPLTVQNQDYLAAFGDWRLREQSFGMYSVALPSNFIVNAAATSRNSLSILFSLATVAVLLVGYLVSRRIVVPLDSLVQTSAAVAGGDLDQRTGISRRDEIGVLADAFDTMTSRLAERNRQLMEQASKVEAILASIADGVVVLDANCQIVTVNPAAELIMKDVARGENGAGSQSGSYLAPNSPMQRWFDDLCRSLAVERYAVGRRIFSALPAPVTTPDGEQLGFVVVMRDITRDVEAEERQNSFVTSISHELRTPLTSVRGFVELLVADGQTNLTDQQLRFAQIISDNTNKLISHVNQVIDIAEIQEGTLVLDRERISFTKLVEQTATPWVKKMEEKGLEYDLQLGESNLSIEGDMARLAWAIDNLIRNAHDYTLDGGQVGVRVFEENGEACLEVADTGVGINATDLNHVFDRFFRAEHPATHSVPGIGLGLFIVRSILEGHNGRVWVESEPDAGSTFGCALPLLD